MRKRRTGMTKPFLPVLALLVSSGLGVSAHAQTAHHHKKKASVTARSPHSAHAHGTRSHRRTVSRRRDHGQKAPTADRISEIQQALSKDGSYAGTPSGQWDDATVAAMKKFQAAHDLNPSGRLDALTLQKLGLGSDTAGVAPPAPAPGTSTVSRLVPPGQSSHPE